MEQTLETNVTSKSTQESPQEPIIETSPITPPVKKTKLLPIFFIVIFVLAFGAGAFYVGSNKDTFFPKKNQSQGEPVEISPTSPEKETDPLFTGTLKKLDNLGIFLLTENDKANDVLESDFAYYSAGIFNRGELQGYTRIIAVRPSIGPSSPSVFTLATKDFKTYLLDDPENKTTKLDENTWDNPYYQLDKKLITGTRTFENSFPLTINLNEKYSLYAENFSTKNIQKAGRIYTELNTDISSFRQLDSPVANLKFYYAPYTHGDFDLSKLSTEQQQEYDLRYKYFLGISEVLVEDSTGLAYLYSLTTPENIKIYVSDKAQYDAGVIQYETKLKQYNDKQITEYPLYPDYVFLPSLGFNSSRLSNTNSLNLFKKYSTAFPYSCANSLNTHIVNLSDNDLEPVAMLSDLQVYRLKDKNHPLYTLAFNSKLSYYKDSPEMWNEVNKGMIQPTLGSYIDKNPLLFIKDFWGRWVALGEYDINLPGGCGKPVVYLYPEKETKVTLSFQAPIQFTVDIPFYRGSWQVLAKPDGKLIDLNQQPEDCQTIDTTLKGSEYAKEACLTNSYPYLYWAGNVTSTNYPKVSSGWIVSKDNLSNFIKEKLSIIGLTSREIGDFSEYWVPEMLSKGTPFYRISFLQNQDLNTLFPMKVNPQPDSVIRVFLDYEPLLEKPVINPKPQMLKSFARHGFTLVEWGGKKI